MAALAILGVDRVAHGALIVIVEHIPVALSNGMPGRYAGHSNLRTEVMVRSYKSEVPTCGVPIYQTGQDTYNSHKRM